MNKPTHVVCRIYMDEKEFEVYNKIQSTGHSPVELFNAIMVSDSSLQSYLSLVPMNEENAMILTLISNKIKYTVKDAKCSIISGIKTNPCTSELFILATVPMPVLSGIPGNGETSLAGPYPH